MSAARTLDRRTAARLAKLERAAELLVYAYEYGATQEEVEWEDLDVAAGAAEKAIGRERVRQIRREIRARIADDRAESEGFEAGKRLARAHGIKFVGAP